MNPTMTLEQVRDKLRQYIDTSDLYYNKTGECLELRIADILADAIDAHLAERDTRVPEGMLPEPLTHVADEWYRLCERRFAVERIRISGDLARAIVEALLTQPSTEMQAQPPIQQPSETKNSRACGHCRTSQVAIPTNEAMHTVPSAMRSQRWILGRLGRSRCY